MIYDISPLVDEHSAVWPGDVGFRREWQCRISQGANIDLSALTSTVHVGAHADAPSHYHAAGLTIDQVTLEAYWGPCEVVRVARRPLVLPEDVLPAIKRGARRILLKTGSQPDRTVFNRDFVAISPDAMSVMGENGVLLVGIDTASVDPFESKDLKAHQELYRYGMRNLEGLDLSNVDAGEYELCAAPLKLVGFDASPVRALLRNLD
jgi:arylformamidase